MNLEELKNKIEEIDITYDYDETYTNLYNTIIDYENETQDWDFEYIFEDYISYDVAEDIARNELDRNGGGLIRIYYFLGDANMNNDLFKINGYGNLEDVDIDDLKDIKERILDEIESKLKEEEDETINS